MDTSEDGRRRRRRHSPEFKTKAVPAYQRPGVSIAAVARANRLNSNLFRRWVAEAQHGQAMSPTFLAADVERQTAIDAQRCVPVTLQRTTSFNEQDISNEVRRGADSPGDARDDR